MERTHCQLRQVEDHVYDQLPQTLGAVHQQTVQVAGPAYLQLVQEEERVQNLPKLYVLERVHPQQVFMENQVPQSAEEVEQVCCHLLRAESRVPS